VSLQYIAQALSLLQKGLAPGLLVALTWQLYLAQSFSSEASVSLSVVDEMNLLMADEIVCLYKVIEIESEGLRGHIQ
jgi:hypothetical protein